jgi:hypothetical protein
LQRVGNVLLSDDLGELLRTVFARQDGVAHGEENTIIRDANSTRRRSPISPSEFAGFVVCSFG